MEKLLIIWKKTIRNILNFIQIIIALTNYQNNGLNYYHGKNKMTYQVIQTTPH